MQLPIFTTFVTIGITSILSLSNPANAIPRLLSNAFIGTDEILPVGVTDDISVVRSKDIQDNQLDFDVNISTSQFPNKVLLGQLPNSTTSNLRIRSLYLGVWGGIVTQTNPAEQYSTLITITEGDTGSIVGTTAYPSLNCVGVLTLQSEHTNSMRLLETITYGNDCESGGVVELQQQSNNSLRYEWRKNGFPGKVIGTVTRTTQI